ncbi:Protein of uncharacterised function (DUF2752) [Enterococcus cecorum]|uniref:DUF2752 domain-containing protein n=1 Tax=Enterococcus cecorum DSM 20682 = ATCC 43198 TaxID=1121864 RepID=S1RI46_9ENTE|nr:hypothetical protein I567_01524 [Enterococcus cecorum DSM 20682 = ATCC 43198]ESK60368.1 hypothetical protein OMO_02411 [Enterococcus cecorum DSM 20682 = ATCC 43198]CAI3361527.1 hypothetical protein CIRMBP1273_01253 [Enterococcus cecorum]CAI3392549.1 hypothetical protein CIRMBP1318_00852 [Enterococcus cecorum DSM 20682 = ATCC 43198]SQE54343.1 Protein of uncharacterised function (DUF2752) [Enterococcus cecorum]
MNSKKTITKSQIQKEIRYLLIILGVGFGYYLWLNFTHLGIPCPFRTITGWLCPGCGITHMLIALIQLDFHTAYLENPFLLLTLPFLIGEIIYQRYLQLTKQVNPQWNQVLLWLYVIALIIFGILRNL